MISAEELALPAEWFEDGIMQLEPDTPLGANVVELFGLQRRRARRRGHEQSRRRDVDDRARARTCRVVRRRAAHAAARESRHRTPNLRRTPDVSIESPDCTRFVAQRFDGIARRAGARVDAHSPGARRPTADQQSRRHLELRDARDRPAAALLRRRAGRERRTSSCAMRATERN